MGYIEWTQEEIDFLVRFYPTHSNKELAETLNRSRASVKAKAIRLNIKKINPNSVIIDGKKRCATCEEMLDLEFFYPEPKNKIGYSSTCRICRSKHGIQKLAIEKLKEETGKQKYTCYTCGATKPGWEFKWSTRKKKRETKCSECRQAQDLENKVKRIKEGRDW